MARSKEEIRNSISGRGRTTETNSSTNGSKVRSKDEIRKSLVTGSSAYNNATNTIRNDYNNALGSKKAKDYETANRNLDTYKAMYGKYIAEEDNNRLSNMSSWYKNMADLYNSPNADALDWATRNSGLTYDEVKKRKETATGKELDYLNQYGTLVGYNSLEDYDAELADTKHLSKGEVTARNIGKVGVTGLGTLVGGVIGGTPGLVGGYWAGKALSKNIDDGSEGNAYYNKLEQSRNLYDVAHRFDDYKGIMDAEDFDKYSTYNGEGDSLINEANTKETLGKFIGGLVGSATPVGTLGSLPGAIIGNKIANSTIDDRELLAAKVNSESKYHDSAYKYATEDELKVFNYLYNKRPQEAKSYVEDMLPLWERRRDDNLQEGISEISDLGFSGNVVLSNARVGAAALGNLTSAQNIIDGVINGEYDAYSDMAYLRNYANYAEREVGESFNEAADDTFGGHELFGTEVPSFLYSTGMSALDSYIGAATLGAGYSFLMGTGAFQSTAKELADKGASQQDIWVKAGASGIAEIVTEYVSLESLEKIIHDRGIDSGRQILKSVLRQAGYEGSEEIASDVINHMVDEIYEGKASDMNQDIQRLIEQGMSPEEAKAKVYGEFFRQMGESFVGGALSGGQSAFVGAVNQYTLNASEGATLRNNNNLQAIDEAAQSISKESDAFKDYSALVGDGSIENVSNAQIATTYRAINEQLAREITDAQVDDVADMLKRHGITEDAKATAKAVKKFISNGYSTSGMSRDEIRLLARENVATIVEGIQSGNIEFSLENSKRKWEQSVAIRRAESQRTVFQDATNIEKTENGYRIYNNDGTTNVVNKDNIETSEAEIMNYVSQYNETAQNIFLENYRKSNNISFYNNAFSDVYAMGKRGETLTHEDINKYGAVLGYKSLSDIYKAGNLEATEDAKKTAEAIDKAIADFRSEDFRGGKFVSRVNYKSLNSKKRKLFKYAQALSSLGLNIEVIDDNRNDSVNGQYMSGSNSILINLSARFSSNRDVKEERQKYVVNTLAHELTHYLEVNAREAYTALRNLIKENLLDSYIGSESVWNTQIKSEADVAKAEAKKNGRTITDDEALAIAESEVIARACEDVLNDNSQMVEILSKNDSGVLKTIRDAIMKFFDKFKAMINKLMDGFKSNSIEAQAIREVDGLLDNVRKSWADAFTQAIAKSQMNAEQTKKMDAIKEEMGIGVSTETNTVASDMNSVKYTLENTFENYGYKTYEELVDDVAKDINEKANIGDIEKVKKWIKAENSISAFIMKEQNRKYLDYEADDRYEAIKKNSDYKQGTFDLSNLCRKREIFTKMFDALQRENPDILFDADDIATIRQVLVDSHYEVACALCYVEDRRQNMGEIADAFIGFYKQALESDSKLLFKYVPGKGGEVKKTGLYPTKAQRDKYGLSATQYKANDPYVPKQVDLVTYEGLKNLQKEHPTIAYAFERYNNSRGQQSARVIEGHAEYKREVLNYTDAMVKKANDLGGLRVFSFSDFEAIHLIDVCQIIVDCAKMGVKIQTYTKVPEFAALVRNTGIKLNRSLIPANVGSQNAYARVMENGKQKFVKVKPYANGIAKYKGNDVLAFDNVEGIDVTSKYFLDETDNANIGNILIGMSEDQIKIAMTDPFIDYIIPFHTGQKLSVLHAKGIAEWKNYKDVQLDKKLPGSTSKEKETNIYRVIEKYNPTNKYEFTEAFLKECEEQKFRPRFDEFITKDADGNYQYTEGYYKLLLDFKMFDSNGNILLQENVRPDIDETLAKKILNEGKKREEQIRFDDDIVNKVKEALADKHTLNSAKRSNGTYEKKAIEHFGTTENFNVAGYILNDGQMLDFSGKHWGDTNSKFRQVDHEDIYEVMEKSGDNRKQFMDRGNIRISPEAPGINISTKAEPTAEQYAKIKEFINTIKDGNRFYVDIEDTKPHKVNYNGKISADRVVNDIKSFYETGVMPTGSEGSLSEFLYSSKRDSDGNNLADAQVEFFKASKARDENGNLMVMYHGTEMGSFDIFEQEGTVANANFFTNSLKVARAYSGSPSIYAPKNFKSVDEFNEFINNKDYRAAYEDGQYNLYLDDEIIESSDSLNDLYRQFWYASGETDSLNYKTYLNATNPYVVDGNGADWDGLTTDINGESMTTNEVVEWARENGYDSVIFRNITDNGLYMSSADRNTITSTVIAVMNSNQIKSVNNINPTSDADIRYSQKRDSDGNILKSVKRTTEEKLTAENEKLKADIDNLRKLVRLQGKETNGFIPAKSSIESAAKSILKSAVSTYDRASLEKDLANVWTKLQKGASIESLNDDIRTIADNVVADIKDEVEVDKTYKQMLRNMRATKVRLTENQIAYAKERYGENYRNAFMGKVILAKNGQSLDTLWEEWTERHPEVFEEGLSEEDMVDGLLEAYATIKEASEYVVELDTELATNAVMQTITEKLWNIASYQTVADKYADQIKQMKAEHRKEMDALKKARDDQRLADDMHYKKLLAQVREQRDERINAIKEFTKMRKETEKQRAERKKTLTKIERISKSLRDKLATDSSKKNVPVNLKVPVLDLLNALDFSSQQLLGMRGGENAFKPTQKDLSIASAMAKLNEQVKASVSAQEDGGFIIDLPGDYADTVAQINTKVTEIQSKVGDSVFVLQQMDNETLNDIADMLEVMNTSVSQMNSLIASRNKHSVDGIAKEIIEESQRKGKRFNFANQGAFARLANGADDFINKKQITPYYFFKHLGSGGVKIFEELQDGFDKYAFHIQDIINYSKENWNGKQVKEWTKDIKKFDIKEMPTQEMIDEGITEGRDVHFEMTVPQIMSLYCLNKREQARKHIEGKGIKIAEFKNGAKMSGDKVVRLTQEQVGEITKVLTEEQLKVADAIQKHMNTVCKNWMNEITMKRFGIIGALEENYFPIKSDSNALSVEANDNNAQGIYRLLNMSFTKQLNINANNEIVVGDIFTVFTDHATDMAKYNTIALPTLDLIKVLNYNETSKTEGSQLQSLRLRNELDTAYGKRAVQYISKMLTDLNGAVRTENGNELVSTLNRNYKIAAVGANLQVALLQGTSAIRASYVLNPKYIARGYAHRPQVKRVQQECGISAWKQLGFYQINVNRGLEHDIRQDESVYDKITDASMKGAEFMDNLTWGYLYNACEEWARGETQFAVDSEEFRQAVNDKFREVVYSTQVVDSTLTRSDLMRIQDGLAKMATSFMAEPTLTYNMVYDAFNGFISDIRKGSTTGQALRSNGRQIAKAMMAFGVAAILESALRAGIAKLRKPEDEEDYWRKLLDYFLSELNPLSKIPYVKDILEIAQGYGSSNMSYGGIESAFQAFNKIKKIVQKGETPTYKEVYIVVNAASQISGVAGSGAMRDVVMLWNTLCRVMGWESLIIK